MKTPKTLQQAVQHFADEQTCIDTIAVLRWPDGPICPRCGHKEHYYLKTQKRWKCKECYKQFSVKLGTIFEDSPITLDKWLCALWMLVNCKNGVSSYEVAKAIGISQKSAWFVLHRLRLALKTGSIEKLGSEGGPVEADETFIGPNPYKQHRDKRAQIKTIANTTPGASLHAPGKTIVMGMLDRTMRQVRAMVIPNVKRTTLQEKILNHIKAGATVITDDFTPYKFALVQKFTHDVVNHAETYANGLVHTQGIENFWSLLKRTLRGTYVAVEPFHLDRYIDEQVFRFNNRATKERKMTDADRFNLALSQIAGKRLTFAEVTGKGSQETF
jgi:transposase-like protein